MKNKQFFFLSIFHLSTLTLTLINLFKLFFYVNINSIIILNFLVLLFFEVGIFFYRFNLIEKHINNYINITSHNCLCVKFQIKCNNIKIHLLIDLYTSIKEQKSKKNFKSKQGYFPNNIIPSKFFLLMLFTYILYYMYYSQCICNKN